VFDSRSFRHHTNPLYVELAKVEEHTVDLFIEVDAGSEATRDKGKGRAVNTQT